MAERSLVEISTDLANRAKAEGCRGVIVAVSRDEPAAVHSSFHVEHRGPCLELEGLTNRIAGVISELWKGLVATRSSSDGR